MVEQPADRVQGTILRPSEQHAILSGAYNPSWPNFET
jgi:hypothetical protein